MTQTYTEEKKQDLPAIKPLLLRFEIKITLVQFIEKYIVFDSLCSERLNDVYNYYKQFSETHYPNIEIPKKRLFKLSLLALLELKNKDVQEYGTNAGVILKGIGLRPQSIEVNGIKINGTEANGIQFNGTEANGEEVNGTKINGTEGNQILLKPEIIGENG